VDAIVLDKEEVFVGLQDRPDVKAVILSLVANETCRKSNNWPVIVLNDGQLVKIVDGNLYPGFGNVITISQQLIKYNKKLMLF
jgi:hypothetical protein